MSVQTNRVCNLCGFGIGLMIALKHDNFTSLSDRPMKVVKSDDPIDLDWKEGAHICGLCAGDAYNCYLAYDKMNKEDHAET